MFCTKCGTNNEDNNVFCKNCGAKLVKPANNSPVSSASSSSGMYRTACVLSVIRYMILLLGDKLWTEKHLGKKSAQNASR